MAGFSSFKPARRFVKISHNKTNRKHLSMPILNSLRRYSRFLLITGLFAGSSPMNVTSAFSQEPPAASVSSASSAPVTADAPPSNGLFAPLWLYKDVQLGTAVVGQTEASVQKPAKITFSITREPKYGAVKLDDGNKDGWVYTPQKDYIGYDEFQVTSTDGVESKATRIVIFLNYAPSKKTYYVDVNKGNDRNPGSEEKPFASIQAAADVTLPGDTVLIKNGTYLEVSKEGVVEIKRSGLPGAMITYKAYPGHKPVLTAKTAWNAVLITGSYIRVEGLEIAGVADTIPVEESEALYESFLVKKDWGLSTSRLCGNGIGVRPVNNNAPLGERIVPRHIEIVGNHVHHVAGGGIYTDVADYILIENNLTHHNAMRSIFANSGISIFHSFDVDNNTTDYKNIIRNNISHSNETKVKWWVTKKFSDGNGIIVDDLKNTQIKGKPYRGRSLVINNISYNNGGAGYQSYSSENVDLFHNVAYKNGLTPDFVGNRAYGELWVHSATNVRAMNNIMVTSENSMINDKHKNQNVIYDYNVYHTSKKPRALGQNDIQADPMFVDPANGDFRLKAGSPAIDSGAPVNVKMDFDGKSRKAGNAPDRGAFEFSNSK
jgi:hypothetical protein